MISSALRFIARTSQLRASRRRRAYGYLRIRSILTDRPFANVESPLNHQLKYVSDAK